MGGTAATALAAVGLLLVAVLAGCGNSSSGATGTGPTSAEHTSPPASGFSKNAEAAAFGEEASDEERTQASETLERNMSARAVGDYEIQCETLSASAAEAIEEEGGCAETLRAEAKNLPPALLENTLMPIAALRVQGKRGIALYHGDDGQDHAMRMELEDGEWKVAATLTETLPTN